MTERLYTCDIDFSDTNCTNPPAQTEVTNEDTTIIPPNVTTQATVTSHGPTTSQVSQDNNIGLIAGASVAVIIILLLGIVTAMVLVVILLLVKAR